MPQQYSTNTFRFANFATATSLPSIFLPQRFQALKSLNFDFTHGARLPLATIQPDEDEAKGRADWTHLWSAIAALPHLERLHVKLQFQNNCGSGVTIDGEKWASILEPLCLVRKNLREFVVRVDWMPSEAWRCKFGRGDFADAPFKIICSENV